ncbi:MAG: histidinol-phosphatase [Gammaproteobacteria bacterium]|nr:histidinol-phosphatase [Gammaproteobacteria bacterium]
MNGRQPRVHDDEIREYLALCEELADAAGAVIMPSFRGHGAVDSKAHGRNFDPVTEADRAAERRMRELIRARYPAHGVVGEEYGTDAGSTRLRWVLDPIDGTRAFITGMPLWGTLIALCDGDEPVLGCVDQPFLGERYTGSRLGARLSSRAATRALATRACAALDDAVLYATDPAMFHAPGDHDAFQRVADRVRLTRYGGDCYAYCMLASGHVDLVIEADLKLYDIAALVPIIEAAGGSVCDWSGARVFDSGRIVAAGDLRVRDAALSLLQAG